MNEIHARIDKAIASYKCALMNDTKWREVLSLIGAHEMLVQFSFVREEEYKSLIYFPENGVEGDHTTDCTVHGPFFLREIFEIRCPRFEEKRDSRTGRKYQDESRYNNFIAEINNLGQLPLTENDYGVIISGYQK